MDGWMDGWAVGWMDGYSLVASQGLKRILSDSFKIPSKFDYYLIVFISSLFENKGFLLFQGFLLYRRRFHISYLYSQELVDAW